MTTPRPQAYYARLQQVLSLLLTDSPPLELIAAWFEQEDSGLEDFCGMHLRPEVCWATCSDTIGAAMSMVDGAIGNANLTADGQLR